MSYPLKQRPLPRATLWAPTRPGFPRSTGCHLLITRPPIWAHHLIWVLLKTLDHPENLLTQGNNPLCINPLMLLSMVLAITLGRHLDLTHPSIFNPDQGNFPHSLILIVWIMCALEKKKKERAWSLSTQSRVIDMVYSEAALPRDPGQCHASISFIFKV